VASRVRSGVFFQLRAVNAPVTVSWVLLQLVSSVYVYLRNSGIQDALLHQVVPRWIDAVRARGVRLARRLRAAVRRRRAAATTTATVAVTAAASAEPRPELIHRAGKVQGRYREGTGKVQEPRPELIHRAATLIQLRYRGASKSARRTSLAARRTSLAARRTSLGHPERKVHQAERDDNQDPIFQLQFLAGLGIQYELADLCALGFTPLLVSFFVLRDGWFSLYGTGVLVRRCDMPSLLSRFVILLFIKIACNVLARARLGRTMRRTLLGKRTLHGVSDLAAKVVASRDLLASFAAGTSAGTLTLGSTQ
jgi:hypothetical protein